MSFQRTLCAACALIFLIPAVSAQSLRDRLKKELRETADEIGQKVDAAAEEASSDEGTPPAAPQSAAAAPNAASAATAPAAGPPIDLEPYIEQAAAVARECRGLPASEQSRSCAAFCDESANKLSAARDNGQAIPQAYEGSVRESIRICGVLRDQAKSAG